MIKNPRVRIFVSILLLIVGGGLIFLAPGNAWLGAVLLLAGLSLEVVSYLMRHSRK